ncbi:MAG: 7-cyano-7-deazaguanine synthase [Sphaerochaetaceae bacterium]|nr:7-cyano-7-deazaguanine synthase [Sphaerochaetaceae bacterium]
MCSISGAIYPEGASLDVRAEIAKMLRDTIIQAEDRGRDSFGIAMVLDGKPAHLKKYIGAPSEYGTIGGLMDDDVAIVINNNRAEPTTEYVKDKRLEDVQPFKHGKWIVAHNGTIANDKELAKKFCVTMPTRIDSAVIPAILEARFHDEFDPEDVTTFLKEELIGSYALAIVHEDYPNDLLLMTNYKPLYVAHHLDKQYFIFTSLEQYMQQGGIGQHLYSRMQVQQVKPYTAVHITRDCRHIGHSVITEYNIKKSFTNRKAVVVCSGGLDSTVVATHAIKAGYDVTLLHFLYKCRAESKEQQAVINTAKRLGCKYTFIETDIFKRDIGGSRLTGTKEKVADGEAGAEFAHEWVPARNLIMLSIAVGWAESHGCDTIMLGNNLEESGAYPDNEMIFIQKLNEVLPFATQVDKHVHIEMPVGNLMKHEIVKYGLEIGAPLDLCWSCYEAGDLHCGKCGPCFMRKTAFQINHAEEVIQYAE